MVAHRRPGVVRASDRFSEQCKGGQNVSHYFYTCRRERGIGLLSVNDAIFHYEGNFLQDSDVVKGIARDGNHIRHVAGL
jgi:hypothetical protein